MTWRALSISPWSEEYFGIWSARFSRDGHEIVVGTSDASLYVHNVERNRSLLRAQVGLTACAGYTCVCYVPCYHGSLLQYHVPLASPPLLKALVHR